MAKRWSLTIGLVAVAVLGCGDRLESSNVGAVVDRRPNADGVLPCTHKDEPTNFDVYSVGSEFEGLPLTYQQRACTHASPIGPPQARNNSVDYIYGDCEIPPGQIEGGCTPPLSVQSWPLCERGFSLVSSREFTIRGVPARFQGGGLALLTGDALVAIFGDDRGHMLRAARSLVRAPAKPSDPVTNKAASGPLPPPKPRSTVSIGRFRPARNEE